MYENTIDDLPINIIPCDCENISMDIEMDAIFLRVPETMTQHEIDIFLNKRHDMILHYWKKMHEGSLTVDDVKPFTLDELKELAKKASVILPEKVENILRSWVLPIIRSRSGDNVPDGAVVPIRGT